MPASAGEELAPWKPTRPEPHVLHLTQQRLREKNFLTSINVPITRYLEVAHKEALPQAIQALGRPCVLKSASFGYDGKGQVRIDPETDLGSVWQSMGGELAILEAFVDFQREISVVIARGIDGAMAMYVPVENQHRNHILDTTIARRASRRRSRRRPRRSPATSRRRSQADRPAGGRDVRHPATATCW